MTDTVGNRIIGTAAPDPILLRAMLKVGIAAASIDDTGRLSMSQLDSIKGTADTVSGRIQLTRLAELAGLLPMQLRPGSPAHAAI